MRTQLEDQARRMVEAEVKANTTWQLLMAPKLNENGPWNGIHALRIRVRVLGEALECLEQRGSMVDCWQSDLSTADEGKGKCKGKQKTEPAENTYGGRLPAASHPLSDQFKELFAQRLATADATGNSRREDGGHGAISSPGAQRAGISATADRTVAKAEGKAVEGPAAAAGAVVHSQPTDQDLEEAYERLRLQIMAWARRMNWDT